MTANPPSDLTYKDDVRREWTAAATGWRKWIDTLEGKSAGRVVTHALLELAGVRRGDHVLDVGSGYGEPGLSAAQAVGPTGHVTCLDISADMFAFGEERSRMVNSAGWIRSIPLTVSGAEIALVTENSDSRAISGSTSATVAANTRSVASSSAPIAAHCEPCPENSHTGPRSSCPTAGG